MSDDDGISVRLRSYANFVQPMVWPAMTGVKIAGINRPPWWRPFARRNWDRTVRAGLEIYAEMASRAGALIGTRT